MRQAETPTLGEQRPGPCERILGSASRRLRAAYLYYRVGYNAREVAEEMGLDHRQVKNILYRLSTQDEP